MYNTHIVKNMNKNELHVHHAVKEIIIEWKFNTKYLGFGNVALSHFKKVSNTF